MKKIEEFVSGHTELGAGYRYFVPTFINDEWIWSDSAISKLLEKAAVKLGELNSFSRLVPNIDLFIQLHVTKEAVTSSRIEGTQTKMDEALLPINEIQPERRDDWTEVNNYINAINQAVKDLEDLPISSRLIRNTHKILLHGVRGEHKLPGQFRTSQNWIGGATISDARYIPPAHSLIGEYMSDLEKFLNNEDINVPSLIRIAIAHYQFETIHPFLDGNGRIGRLLITLFLVKEKILEKPLLYISSFFEKHRDLYYDNLNGVRTKNDLQQWIKYFLVGIEQTAEAATQTLSDILQLKTDVEDFIRSNYGRRSTNAIKIIHRLMINPYINIEQAMEICNTSYNPSNDLLKQLQQDGYITETSGQSRNRLFIFKKYLDLFDKTDK